MISCKLFFILYFTRYFILNAVITETNEQKQKNSVNNNVFKKWEFEIDNELEYPRGDKTKLHQISKLWSAHYACSRRLARTLTPANRLPAKCLATTERARAQLPCALCRAPGDPAVAWIYSQSPDLTVSPLEYDERMVVLEDGSLVISNVMQADAGTYKCTVGQSVGGPVFLEVTDKSEPYNVVKPTTSRGPYPAPSQHFRHHGLSMVAFTSWSPWSECSACARVGRRRRHGMCYVNIDKDNKTYVTQKRRDKNQNKNFLKLWQEFPEGFPCRSRLLPQHLRSLSQMVKRRNEIMIGLCKVPCDKVCVYEVRSSSGALLERANNSARVYALSQRVPSEPPAPVYETKFAAIGEKLTLTCPGTSHKDIPVNWRIGTKVVVPRDVDQSSGGRVHLNARDDLVFTEIRYEDANVYSCWARDVLIGAVKLEAWDPRPYYCRHVALLAALFVAGGVLRACDAAVRNKRRRAM